MFYQKCKSAKNKIFALILRAFNAIPNINIWYTITFLSFFFFFLLRIKGWRIFHDITRIHVEMLCAVDESFLNRIPFSPTREVIFAAPVSHAASALWRVSTSESAPKGCSKVKHHFVFSRQPLRPYTGRRLPRNEPKAHISAVNITWRASQRVRRPPGDAFPSYIMSKACDGVSSCQKALTHSIIKIVPLGEENIYLGCGYEISSAPC